MDLMAMTKIKVMVIVEKYIIIIIIIIGVTLINNN